MIIGDVCDEIATALGAVTDLRVYPYQVSPPPDNSAIVRWPERLVFDRTLKRGFDALTIKVNVFIAYVDPRTAQKRMNGYLDGSAGISIKAAIEAGTYTACDIVRVTEATVTDYQFGEVLMLGAEFTLEIKGRGA